MHIIETLLAIDCGAVCISHRSSTLYAKTPTFLFFEQLCQKLTDFKDFYSLNPEKIWHQ